MDGSDSGVQAGSCYGGAAYLGFELMHKTGNLSLFFFFLSEKFIFKVF